MVASPLTKTASLLLLLSTGSIMKAGWLSRELDFISFVLLLFLFRENISDWIVGISQLYYFLQVPWCVRSIVQKIGNNREMMGEKWVPTYVCGKIRKQYNATFFSKAANNSRVNFIVYQPTTYFLRSYHNILYCVFDVIYFLFMYLRDRVSTEYLSHKARLLEVPGSIISRVESFPDLLLQYGVHSKDVVQQKITVWSSWQITSYKYNNILLRAHCNGQWVNYVIT